MPEPGVEISAEVPRDLGGNTLETFHHGLLVDDSRRQVQRCH